ncbi:MAG TPA: RES family NAD+ phosphorylase [Thermoanaerobaculia bacterium]|nr:RES family NAD+ phosphorylase [Thermoanaerobaculia bacterium]
MITTYRIVKARYAATAFDGEGARVSGGRWSSRGTAMVYTSESAALAALEMLVHFQRGAVLPAYVVIPCSFDQSLVSNLNPSILPRNWRSYPAPRKQQLIGDDWVKRGSSAVLRVPSVIIASESNYLLNPRHADFASIRIGSRQRFKLDLRLIH